MSVADARRPERRIDGFDKVTGAARYAADVARPGMLWGKVLRSPLPHARIVSIDADAAKALPGVHAVLTALDLPNCRVGRSTRDMPVLARDKVRFIGEKVVAVAAESREIAEEALRLVEVEYDELPAVFDPLEAMQPGAPLIHEPAEVRARKTPAQVVAAYPNSVTAPVWGAEPAELEAAFARAAHVFEHTFRTPIQHQAYLEPHCCTVEVDRRGVVHIWASNKAPFLLFDYLEQGIGLRRELVEFHMLPLGGDFGGKGSFMDMPLAYELAKASGRPVRLAMTYSEELQAGNPRHAAVVTVKSGFDAGGKFVAHLTRSIYASGGYAAFKPAPHAGLPGMESGGRGPYDVPVWRVEAHMVYTNTVPGGHMRAPGEAQPMHAIECHLDLCARAMGLDPLDLRLRNVPTHPRETPSGAPGSPPRGREVLLAASEAVGWDRGTEGGRDRGTERHRDNPSVPPSLRPSVPSAIGRGIALVHVGNSLGVYSARMVVERDGTVVLHTPMMENGAGMLTVFRQLVGEAFGLPLERVAIVQTLAGIEYDRGIGGSRITRLLGTMIGILGERLQRRLAGLLAAELGQRPERIAVEPGGFRAPDGCFHPLADVAALADAGLVELLRYEPGPFDRVEVFAAQAAEVELDGETGQVRVRRAVTAHEVGKVVNPLLHQGQIDGGLVQGLGFALTEGLVLDEGRVVNANFHEYKLPTVADVPRLETILLPPDPSLGITPIGEGPNCGMSAAIVNAVADAIARLRGEGAAGSPRLEIPITPEQVMAKLRTG